ncbi:FAD-binding oxidoreductase [Pusillimonas sp. MFBS29]|uniref:FAD-binding oxidoreductase n=1 Tax=Pusillimonas sp. MFBS29 TaxID=2886690 RepID=UPI001D114D57|nr:FAD-binding oxidoreductase [Pusillimonas sp. MFBS29]
MVSQVHDAYRRSQTFSPETLASITSELVRIVGADRVWSGQQAQQRYPGDKSWLTIVHAHHGRPLNQPELAAAPTTVEQVAKIMQFASSTKLAVTPLGGGSGVQGAANANLGGLLLDLTGLNRIREVDEQSLTCTVECGMNVMAFDAELGKCGLTFTHDPASAEWASIGGAIAARGSGVLSTRYGNIQDHVLSVEVVLPDGQVVQLPAVPRHGVGPELSQLFVGSEGVLGIVTAARVKVQRQPKARRFSAIQFPSLAAGIAAGQEIMTTGLRPAVIRLYDAKATALSLSKIVRSSLEGVAMVVMVEGQHAALVDLESSTCEQICISHGGKLLDAQMGQLWWDNRYDMSRPPHSPELPQIWMTMDAVSDFRSIQGLYDGVTQALAKSIDPKWGLTLKTHLSHWYEWGAMIYARVGVPRGPDNLDEAVALHDQIVAAAVRATLAAGGVINDHHGVGMRLAPHMAAQFGSAGMSLLQGVKSGLDPAGILCPGKLGLNSSISI